MWRPPVRWMREHQVRRRAVRLSGRTTENLEPRVGFRMLARYERSYQYAKPEATGEKTPRGGGKDLFLAGGICPGRMCSAAIRDRRGCRSGGIRIPAGPDSSVIQGGFAWRRQLGMESRGGRRNLEDRSPPARPRQVRGFGPAAGEVRDAGFGGDSPVSPECEPGLRGRFRSTESRCVEASGRSGSDPVECGGLQRGILRHLAIPGRPPRWLSAEKRCFGCLGYSGAVAAGGGEVVGFSGIR